MKNKLRISLDLDGTLFDWHHAHEAKFHCKLKDMTSAEITEQVHQCKFNKLFWENLPVIERIDFIPSAYITKRENLKSYTRNCIINNGFPNKKVYQMSIHDSKAPFVKRYSDVLIDDDYDNVMDCINKGVPALLITRSHNKYINTPYRVDHLCYAEIETKYNQLFK